MSMPPYLLNVNPEGNHGNIKAADQATIAAAASWFVYNYGDWYSAQFISVR